MLVVIDKRIPEQAKETLSLLGNLLEIETRSITYEAISGHPDIFMCQSPTSLVVAPNLPQEILSWLRQEEIDFVTGSGPVGSRYPATACYNAVITGSMVIHRGGITEAMILGLHKERTFVDVNQGYTRCSLLALPGERFITSDLSIEKALSALQKDVLYVPPQGILLPGMEHGFFGGCCGILRNEIFVLGNLDLYPGGEQVKFFASSAGLTIISLYDGPLWDGGGIFFLGK